MPNLIWELGADSSGYRKEVTAAEGATTESFTKIGATVTKEGERASGGIEGVKRTLGRLRDFVLLGGFVQAFRQMYGAGVEWAQKHENANEADAQSMLRLKEAADKFGSVAGRAFAWVAGTMEKAGLAVGSLVYGVDAAAEAYNQMTDSARKAFDAERAKEMTKATAELAKVQRDGAFDLADSNGKINILLGERLALSKELNGLERDSVDYVAKQTEIAKIDVQMTKILTEERRKAADEAKKAAEERIAEHAKQAELQKRAALDMDTNIADARLLAKSASELTEIEKETLRLHNLQREQKAKRVELEELLTKKNTDGLTPAEEQQLSVLVKQYDKLGEEVKVKQNLIAGAAAQKAAEQEVTAEFHKQVEEAQTLNKEFANFRVSVSRIGQSYDQQSTTALTGVRDRLRSQLTQTGAGGMEIRNATVTGNYGDWLAASTIRSELDKVEQELALRQSVQQYATRYGESAARYQYGDTVTQRALSNLADQSNRAAIATEQINQRLNSAGYGLNGPR